MSDLKSKTKDKIDDVAAAAKTTAGKAIDKTKDLLFLMENTPLHL